MSLELLCAPSHNERRNQNKIFMVDFFKRYGGHIMYSYLLAYFYSMGKIGKTNALLTLLDKDPVFGEVKMRVYINTSTQCL